MIDIINKVINSRYNKTLINVGSIGNNLDYIRNDLKDSDNMETTRATYLIMEGLFNSHDYSSSISYSIIKVPYDIQAELHNDLYNPEKNDYAVELEKGRYRDLQKTYKSFAKKGIDIDNI